MTNDTIGHRCCGATGAVQRGANGPVAVEDAVLLEQRIEHIKAQVHKDTAARCLAIATGTLSTPEGFRFRDASEIAHAIMREMLGWSGV